MSERAELERRVRELTIEEVAKLIESRCGRAARARGGIGQICANTQDQEALECAAVIRALLSPAQPAHAHLTTGHAFNEETACCRCGWKCNEDTPEPCESQWKDHADLSEAKHCVMWLSQYDLYKKNETLRDDERMTATDLAAFVHAGDAQPVADAPSDDLSLTRNATLELAASIIERSPTWNKHREWPLCHCELCAYVRGNASEIRAQKVPLRAGASRPPEERKMEQELRNRLTDIANATGKYKEQKTGVQPPADECGCKLTIDNLFLCEKHAKERGAQPPAPSDKCADLIEENGKSYHCELRKGHTGCHEWGRLAQPPADGLRAILRQVTTALEGLLALVEGEVPSLLEDDHHWELSKNALEAGNAALAARVPRPPPPRNPKLHIFSVDSRCEEEGHETAPMISSGPDKLVCYICHLEALVDQLHAATPLTAELRQILRMVKENFTFREIVKHVTKRIEVLEASAPAKATTDQRCLARNKSGEVQCYLPINHSGDHAALWADWCEFLAEAAGEGSAPK